MTVYPPSYVPPAFGREGALLVSVQVWLGCSRHLGVGIDGVFNFIHSREGERGRDGLDSPVPRSTSCPSAYEKRDSFCYFSFKEK